MDYLARGLRALAARATDARPATPRPAARRRPLHFEPLEARQMLAAAMLIPSADAYSTGGAGGGTAAVLQVLDNVGGADAVAYFRFDLASLNIASISSATLTLSKVAGTRNDTINTARFVTYGLTSAAGNTAQDWSETGLGAGGLGAEYLPGGNLVDAARLTNLDAGAGANVVETVDNAVIGQTLTGPDLVSFLNSRVDDNGLATLIAVVDAGAAGRGWGYASRESADPALRPTLQIVYEEAPPEPEPESEPVGPSRQVELLDRGVVAIRRSSTQAYIGWRLLGTDPANIAFNVYRAAGAGAPVKLNGAPVAATTDFIDATANFAVANTYSVRPVVNGVELPAGGEFTLAANAAVGYYLDVPLQIPQGGTTPTGEAYTYTANDASVGDLDGDGQYEIILKWDPTNAKDNSQAGYTGNVYVDAYKLDGTRMWRIDLGRNIRAGAHYTQFVVYDFDGDGRAEVAMKTAPGTVDGAGNAVLMAGHVATSDFRNTDGYILTGPEYLTIFTGLTGANAATVAYQPARGSVSQWGDGYGNRVDRFTAGVGYFDGQRPSLVMGRGYYGGSTSSSQARNEIAAYDYRNGQLTLRWHFRAGRNINNNINSSYIGQGTHGLSIADVDGDGFDEVVYGASVIDHNGAPLYSTGLGHGDALHVSDMDPTRPGLEVFMPHEGTGGNGHVAASYRDAATGQLLVNLPPAVQYLDDDGVLKWPDVGRGVAMDIDPNHLGYEFWNSYHPSIYNAKGEAIYAKNNAFTNFGVWWDADFSRELLDGTTIAEWNYAAASPGRTNFDLNPNSGGTQSAPGVSSVNGTKATPNLSADILGDWREEILWRTSDNAAMRIFTTHIAATSRMVTLMHDTQYREAIAWQNTAYNQPPHPSFYLGAGMTAQPAPLVYAVSTSPRLAGDFNGDSAVDALDLALWNQNAGKTGTGNYLQGDANGDLRVDGFDFVLWQRNLGATPPVAAASVVAAPENAANSLSAGPSDAEAADAALADLAISRFAVAGLRAGGLPGATVARAGGPAGRAGAARAGEAARALAAAVGHIDVAPTVARRRATVTDAAAAAQQANDPAANIGVELPSLGQAFPTPGSPGT